MDSGPPRHVQGWIAARVAAVGWREIGRVGAAAVVTGGAVIVLPLSFSIFLTLPIFPVMPGVMLFMIIGGYHLTVHVAAIHAPIYFGVLPAVALAGPANYFGQQFCLLIAGATAGYLLPVCPPDWRTPSGGDLLGGLAGLATAGLFGLVVRDMWEGGSGEERPSANMGGEWVPAELDRREPSP